MTRTDNGFSIIELLVAVVLIGIIALFAFPRVRAGMIRSDVRSARTTIVALHAKARANAIQGNRRTALRFAGNTAFVTAAPRRNPGVGTIDTLGGIENLGGNYKVTLASTSDSLPIDQRGIGLITALTTVVVSRDGVADSVLISGFGLVEAR